MIADCGERRVAKLHLEVRANNPAIGFYARHGFVRIGVRRGYYRNRLGDAYDAHTYARPI